MSKKGLAVWVFSSLTFVSVVHLVEAIYVFISGSPIRLLRLYPLIGERLGDITPATYLWVLVPLTAVFWGVTCAITFDNPMEDFLNKVLSDAKKQSAAESKVVEEKSEMLDAMYETIESNSQTMAGVKDMICNVRTEVKEIQPLVSAVDLIRLEVSELAKEVEGLEGKMQYSYVCVACGKPLLPEFKICPYCGESTKLLKATVMAATDQK